VSECRHFNHNHPKKQEKERFDGFYIKNLKLKKKTGYQLTGEKIIRYLVNFEFIYFIKKTYIREKKLFLGEIEYNHCVRGFYFYFFQFFCYQKFN
jgi:hypothetical protein